jgi:hypothetical protein
MPTFAESSIQRAWNHPWYTWWSFIHSVLWRVAGDYCNLDSGAIWRLILILGRLSQAAPLSNSTVCPGLYIVDPRFEFWHCDHSRTSFEETVSAYSIPQALSAISKSISGVSKPLNIWTFSIISAIPGRVANTLLILALLLFGSLWPFPICMLLFPANWQSSSWASQDLVAPFHYNCTWTHIMQVDQRTSCIVGCLSM